MTDDKEYTKWLEWEFYEIDNGYSKKLSALGMPELLQELEKQLTYVKDKDGYTETSVKNWDYHDAIKQEICNRLAISQTTHLKKLIVEVEEGLKAQLKDLEEKFKNHRHSIEKTYGEKPVW
jgi:hypothetical protein